MRGVNSEFMRVARTRGCSLLEPACMSAVKPKDAQLDLFRLYDLIPTHARVGTFYEVIASALFGGRVVGNMPVQLPSGEGDFSLFTDVVDLAGRKIIESKACGGGHTLLLKDRQRANYTEVEAACPDFDISFCIFRHGLPHTGSFSGGEHDLYAHLSQTTRFMIRLPFSIIRAIPPRLSRSDGVALTSHYSGSPTAAPSTRVSQGFIRTFFEDPKLALETMGVDPAHYDFSYHYTPPGLNVQREERDDGGIYFIKSLPVLDVRKRSLIAPSIGFVGREAGLSALVA